MNLKGIMQLADNVRSLQPVAAAKMNITNILIRLKETVQKRLLEVYPSRVLTLRKAFQLS